MNNFAGRVDAHRADAYEDRKPEKRTGNGAAFNQPADSSGDVVHLQTAMRVGALKGRTTVLTGRFVAKPIFCEGST
jgi:hypothetical protein